MLDSKGHLQIDVLGTSFAIEADEQSEYLQKIYSHYKQVLEEVEKSSGLNDVLKVSIIAGILLADELAKEKLSPQLSLRFEQDVKIFETATQKMIKELDAAIALGSSEET